MFIPFVSLYLKNGIVIAVAAGTGHQTKSQVVQFRPKQVVRREERWNEKDSGSTKCGVGTQNSCRSGWMSMSGNGIFQVFQVNFEC